MKELSIEQKAKRYDEAIEKAKSAYRDYKKQLDGIDKKPNAALIINGAISALEILFPELRESEDERIRKWIIGVLSTYEHDRDLRNAAIAWLEKQGEQPKKHDVCDNCDQQGSCVSPCPMKLVEKQGEQKPNKGKSALEATKEEKIDNQNCVKPTKVEPKFHKGEWLCENEPNNYARFIQILETVNVQDKERYRISRDIHNDEDIVEFDFVEKYYHKFDIQDAKDGDVLCTYECAEPKIVFILKGTPKKHYALSYHCYYNIMYPHFGSDFEKGCLSPNDEDVKPATKEQHDLLFQKMKEAGYEWDFDKKELKKIEQTEAEWSEKDERIFKIIIDGFEDYNSPEADWWKGLKVKECIDWLKSLRERKFCHKIKSWSEEDEVRLKVIVSELEKYIRIRQYYTPLSVDDLHWLKSFSPQNTWKPSDEQMEALHYVTNFDYGGHKATLVSLYEQLKKLMEE